MKFKTFFSKTLLSIIFVSAISAALGFTFVQATATGGLRILGLGILDSTSTVSIDTNARKLYSNSGTTMNLDWSTANTVKFNNIIGLLGSSSTPYYTYFHGGNQAADINYTFPNAQGASSTVLTNDGTGVLTWATSTSGSAGAALLTGSNQPFTGSIGVTKVNPAFTLTSTDDSSYAATLSRSATNRALTLKNYVGTPGVLGNAASLNGSTQYFSIANPSNFDFEYTQNWSLDVWVKHTAGATYDAIFAKRATAFTAGYDVIITPTGAVLCDVGYDINYYARAVSISTVTPGVWTHVVVTYSGSGANTGFKVYINSSSSSMDTSFSNTLGGRSIRNSENASIGKLTSAYAFPGLIDEVVFKTGVMSQSDVTSSYNSGAGTYHSTDATTVGLWHLDEANGNATDSSGNSNTGNNNGTATFITGKINTPASAAEGTLLNYIDGTGAGEKGIAYIGDASSRTVIQGLTTRFNVAGVEKGQLGSTMAWSLPNVITGATDATQLKVLSNSTQTTDVFDIFDSNGTTLRMGLTPKGYLKLGDPGNTLGDGPQYQNLWITGTYVGIPNHTVTEYGNTVIGDGAGYSTTGAIGNTLIGNYAGYGVTTGSYNVGIGMRTSVSQTGNNNVIIGYRTGGSLTGGANNNVAIGGSSALGSSSAGASNLAIGTTALGLLDTGVQNVALGESSGYSMNGNGSRNVFLGYWAGHYLANGNDNFYLDNRDRTNTAGEQAGALMVGKFDASAANQTLRVNGRLGINIAPTAELTLPAGTATAGTAPLKFTSGTLLTASEAGAIEFNNDDYYATITTGAGGGQYVTQNPPAFSSTYVKHTSDFNANFLPYYAMNPSSTLSGDWNNNSWMTGASTNQRMNIDLGAGNAAVVKRIYYENMLFNTTEYTNRGVRAFTVWGSNTDSAFADTTYANDANWTQITTDVSEMVQHTAAIPDPRYVMLTNTTAYRYYSIKAATCWGGTNIGLRHLELQIENTSPAQKIVPLVNSGKLTSGRVPFATTNGRLKDDASLTYDGTILSATKIVSNGAIRLKGYTVATLPTGTTGDTAYVTDALAPTFLATIVGGGAVVTPVFYNGSAWVGY